MPSIDELMSNCILCPRQCHADRLHGQVGFCGMAAVPVVARASLHMWEEPCISGASGSGTVFFTGCNMQCIFCQNREIALSPDIGKPLGTEELCQVFLRLQEAGANNINLVTASHFIPQVAEAIALAKDNCLNIPVVYNTGSYEEVEALKLLDGLVDIYLPDLKYYSSELSGRLSQAPDYFLKASAAIEEMYRQVGPVVYSDAPDISSPCSDDYSDHNLMKKGLIVRHLVLPGQVPDSKRILRYLRDTYGNQIRVSIMNQYTPLPDIQTADSNLKRRLTPQEYKRVLAFAEALNMENAYIQEGDVASESFIPDFHDPSLL